MPVSPSVYAVITRDGAALMDPRSRRGRWSFLNPVGAALWQRLADGASPAGAVEELTAHWEARGADPLPVRADLTALVDDLTRARLLTDHHHHRGHPTPPPAPVEQVRFAAAPAPGLADRTAGLTGLVLALFLLRCTPIRVALTVARTVARIPLPSASAAEGDAAFAAVRRAAHAWPGRAACLEESLAAYLAATLRGRRVRWVLGVRFDPAGAHAWIEAGGEVIGQDETDRAWPYVPALRI